MAADEERSEASSARSAPPAALSKTSIVVYAQGEASHGLFCGRC